MEPVWRSDGSQPYAQRVTSVTAADTTGTYSANVGTALCSRGDRSPSRSHQSATDWPTPRARMIAVKAVRPYPRSGRVWRTAKQVSRDSAPQSGLRSKQLSPREVTPQVTMKRTTNALSAAAAGPDRRGH